MKVLLLNSDTHSPIQDQIVDTIHDRDPEGQVVCFSIDGLSIPMCIGCGACTEKCHGLCVFDGDIHEVMKEWASSDLVIQIDRVTFGGYSSLMKRVLDHLMLMKRNPYIIFRGELHHENRYTRLQSFWVLGISTSANPRQAKTFSSLVSRQQLSLKSPIAETVVIDQDCRLEGALHSLKHTLESVRDRVHGFKIQEKVS